MFDFNSTLCQEIAFVYFRPSNGLWDVWGRSQFHTHRIKHCLTGLAGQEASKHTRIDHTFKQGHVRARDKRSPSTSTLFFLHLKLYEWTPTLPKPSVFVYYTVSREFKKQHNIWMTLASSYTMLFVGPEDVCFVKKKKKKGTFTCWLSKLSFLYKHSIVRCML